MHLHFKAFRLRAAVGELVRSRELVAVQIFLGRHRACLRRARHGVSQYRSAQEIYERAARRGDRKKLRENPLPCLLFPRALQREG